MPALALLWRAAFAVLALLALGMSAHAQGQPNIVVIMTDDQDVASLAYMPKTRALLADKGVTFANSFVQFPQCCPTRATWMSGQFAHNHGVMGNLAEWNGAYQAWKPQEENSLPVWLQAAGYTTGFLGKVMNGFAQEAYHVPPGWSWFRGMKVLDYYNWSIYQASGQIGTFGQGAADYSTDNLAWRAANFVTAHSEPFLLYAWPFAPHVNGSGVSVPAPRHVGMFANEPMPHNPTFNTAHMTGKHPIVAEFPRMSVEKVAQTEAHWRSYIETLQAVDDMVETVVMALEARGVLENTYVVFTSDNGILFGDWKKPGKALPYERSVRVPLIVRGPGVPEGIVRDEIVTDADVAATVVALSGATPGRVLDGRSIVPLLSTAPAAWRSAVLMTGLFDTSDTSFTRWNAVRTRDRKYVLSSDGHEELYDLEADLYERFSVVADPFYADDLTALRALEARLKSCAGESCWVD